MCWWMQLSDIATLGLPGLEIHRGLCFQPWSREVIPDDDVNNRKDGKGCSWDYLSLGFSLESCQHLSDTPRLLTG